jgi:hypothetical protein
MYIEDYLCGRFQFGIGLKPETHGNFWNHTDRMIDTGSDECDPPKKGCPDDAFVDVVVALPSLPNTRRECPDWYPVTYTINSQSVNVIKSIPPEYVPGKGLPIKAQPYSVTFSAVGKSNGEVCARDSETVTVPNCEECTPCLNSDLTVTKQKGNMLYVGNPPPGTYYTVGGSPDKHYTSGTYGPFAEECESRITIRVNLYDEKCGEPVKCNHWDTSFAGECQECVDVSLQTRDCFAQSTGLNTYKVKCGVKATGGTSRTYDANPGPSGNLPDGVGFQVIFDARCENSGDVTYEIYDGDELCESETVPWETPECRDPCVLVITNFTATEDNRLTSSRRRPTWPELIVSPEEVCLYLWLSPLPSSVLSH